MASLPSYSSLQALAVELEKRGQIVGWLDPDASHPRRHTCQVAYDGSVYCLHADTLVEMIREAAHVGVWKDATPAGTVTLRVNGHAKADKFYAYRH